MRLGQLGCTANIHVLVEMDALYTTLRRKLWSTLDHSGRKAVIDVRMTQPPGQAAWLPAADHFRVSSPTLYRAPVELTDRDLLAQSMALPLLTSTLAQASEQYQIDLA